MNTIIKHSTICGIILLSTLSLLSSCSKQKESKPEATATATDSLPVMVMRIQQCSRLYSAEYRVHKIVTASDVKRLQGTFLGQQYDLRLPATERQIAIPMDAVLKGYVDMSTINEDNVIRHGDKIEIILPDPKVVMTSSKIDHKGINEHTSLFSSHYTDKEMAQMEQKGRAAILADIPKMDIIDNTQQNAARNIIPIIMQMGYKEENITITFRKDFNSNNLQRIIETPR